MAKVVGVRFQRMGKVYDFVLNEVEETARGGHVLVDTAKGVELGQVVSGPREYEAGNGTGELKRVVRQATLADMERAAENEQKAGRALALCREKVFAHGVPMRPVDAEYSFTGNRVTIYFTADDRVDFRDLVRDLAGNLRVRVELRQIGVRDAAKLLGGIGPCGRLTCCSTFLTDFEPVSIRMAKDQHLSLNPSKLSGLCGRLKCCLRYEYGGERYPDANGDGCNGCTAAKADGAGAVAVAAGAAAGAATGATAGATIGATAGAAAGGGCGGCSHRH